MASLVDLWSKGSTGLGPGQISTSAINEGEARADEGLAQSRLLTNFTRANRNLVNTLASRGAFHTGMKGVRADELRQDYANEASDLTIARDRQIANMQRQRALAAFGIGDL